MRFRFLLLFVVLGVLTGCSTTNVDTKQADAISVGVYAINDSMIVGRFDKAKQYSDETIRLVTPPKKRIIIKPFIVQEYEK